MATYQNFFETVEESNLRLKGTVVLYDKEPYYVWMVTNHKPGPFRIYMSPLLDMKSGQQPPCIHHYPAGHAALGPAMDVYADKQQILPGLAIIRKNMDSPLFNKYRPFPLGMMNAKGAAVYVERSPNRPKTEQGLTVGQLKATKITAGANGAHTIALFSPEFKDCILGDHPSPKEALRGILSDENINESVAFHRNFALVKGPIGTLFLAYKQEVVGLLPSNSFSMLRLGKEFRHLKEAVKELNLFSDIA